MNTVYLDRDGVINKKLSNDYVKSTDEFTFIKGAIKAIYLLKKNNFRIIIVTNQQGIGKGLLTKKDFFNINNFMLKKIKLNNGDIDKIYYCPHLEIDNCKCRKPKTGMIKQSLLDFPDIDLKKAFLIGDSCLDVELAKKMNIKSIIISEKLKCNADFNFKDLLTAVKFIITHIED